MRCVFWRKPEGVTGRQKAVRAVFEHKVYPRVYLARNLNTRK
jgi:hypothetical protein